VAGQTLQANGKIDDELILNKLPRSKLTEYYVVGAAPRRDLPLYGDRGGGVAPTSLQQAAGN